MLLLHMLSQGRYLKLYNLLGDELEQFELFLRFLVLLANFSTAFLHCTL